jgi:chemotaxis signal transduction protein
MVKNHQLSLTTFVLKVGETEPDVHCLGSRDIMELDGVPQYILGITEFDSEYIPVVDLAIKFGFNPTRLENLSCILIVEHVYEFRKLYTGIIIEDFQEIMELAAGIVKVRAGFGASINLNFILKMYNNAGYGYDILAENHKSLSLLEKTAEKSDQCQKKILVG